MSNDAVIQRVSENFVPLAVNLYKVRQAQDAGGELFRSVQRQKDQYQGIWIVSPDGEVLAGHHDIKDHNHWSEEVLATIETGLKAYGTVPPRRVQPTDPLPYRGRGVQSNGSVELALYGRQMLGGGRETLPAGIEPSRAWLWDGPYRPDGPVMIDSVALTAEEWAGFVPARAEAGVEWSVPEKVARTFTRLLSASSDQAWMPLPEDAKIAELRAAVESVDGGLARLRLAGRWEMVHAIEGNKDRLTYGAATARGVAIYDGATQVMRSVLLIFDGTIRDGRQDASGVRTGAVVEWRSAQAPERPGD